MQQTRFAGIPARQRGLTMWGWLYVLATAGAILMVGIKCLPIILNNYDIRSTLEWASKQPDLAKAPVSEIRQRIQRRFDSGYVDNVGGRDVQVKRTKEGRMLIIEYEVREPLVYNVSLFFDFRETALLMTP